MTARNGWVASLPPAVDLPPIAGTRKMALTRRQIMKRMAYPFTYLTALAVAAAALLATSTLASARPARVDRVDRVEARITELHTKLKITPAQEDLWKNVTQVMLDNAQTLDALTKARSDHTKTMTAVDRLTSYSDIAEAHAEGLKKFIPAFGALYASMSDAQKHNADTLFRHRSHTRSKRH